MFENYDIQILTKTVNTISEIWEGSFAYDSTHQNEGIIEVRIFDVENGYTLVSKKDFEPAINNEEAFQYIQKTINNYEKKSAFQSGMVAKGDTVKIDIGYREGDTGEVIWVDEENLVCKVIFEDIEVYGYDVNSLKILIKGTSN